MPAAWALVATFISTQKESDPIAQVSLSQRRRAAGDRSLLTSTDHGRVRSRSATAARRGWSARRTGEGTASPPPRPPTPRARRDFVYAVRLCSENQSLLWRSSRKVWWEASGGAVQDRRNGTR